MSGLIDSATGLRFGTLLQFQTKIGTSGFVISGSNFTPASISGLTLFLDPSDPASITQSAGSISQWKDKSGANNNATQVIGAEQPTLQTAALNGLNTVRLTSAASQSMALTSTISLPAGYTLCAVVRRGGPAGGNAVNILGLTSNANAVAGEWFASDSVVYGYSSTQFLKGLQQNDTGYNQISWVSDPAAIANCRVYFNGFNITTATTGASPCGTSFNRLGQGDVFSNGELAEICVYNRILSDSERQQVESYLKTKWLAPLHNLPRSLVAIDAYWKSGLNVASIAKNQLSSSGVDQYIAYYDTAMQPTIIKNGVAFKPASLPNLNTLPVGASGLFDDLHKCFSIAVDSAGFIHVSYGMHAQALVYYVSNNPGDPSAFTAGTMLGTNETSVTYPLFVKHPATGVLYFTFRDGGSGNGNQMLYQYNAGTKTWSAPSGTAAGGLLIDGKTGTVSAYLNGLPKWDSAGANLWFSFSLRDQVSQADRNQYLLAWTGSGLIKFGGAAQTLPAADANLTPIVTIANTLQLGTQEDFAIDAAGIFHIAYSRKDVSNNLQFYVAESSTGAFVERQLTNSVGLPIVGGATVISNGTTAHVITNDAMGRSFGIVDFKSSNHFVAFTSGYIDQSYNPNWTMNLDPTKLLSNQASFLFMQSNDPQFGLSPISTTSPPATVGQLFLMNWVPA